MFNINTKALKEKVEVDSIEEEVTPTFSDKVSDFKLFLRLRTLVDMILNANEMGIKEFGELYESAIAGLSEDEEEELGFIITQFLRYLKVPDSTIEDLIGDDKEISEEEFENLVELLIDRIGEGDVDEFIAYAMYNPDLPDDLETDDIQFDWAFYTNINDCKKGDPLGGKPKSDNQKCVKGFNNGKKGFWRYPKGDFPNGGYKLKNGGVRTKKEIPQFKGKRHKSTAEKERQVDMKKRKKLGMNVFAGYAAKRKAKKSSQYV
jgi:hypothetical protein